jgi:DNA polymerase-3 subunit epsilon
MIDLSYLASFDIESTGVDVLNDRMVTASIVYLDPSGNIISNYEWLINPGVEIPEGASAIHGVTTEIATTQGRNPVESTHEIGSVLSYFLNNGVPVVAYNAAYDFSLLNAEVKRHLQYEHGLAAFLDAGGPIPPPIIDPYILDLRLDKWRKGSRTLTATAQHYGVSLEAAHRSYDDCVAAAEIARALWTTFPDLQKGTYEELYELQVEWYHDIMHDRRDYFEKQGKEMNDFSDVWPIRTA